MIGVSGKETRRERRDGRDVAAAAWTHHVGLPSGRGGREAGARRRSERARSETIPDARDRVIRLDRRRRGRSWIDRAGRVTSRRRTARPSAGWKSTPVVEGLLGSGFAGTPRARFWRAIRTCLPPTDRRDDARFADGTRDAMDGTRAPVERRATPRGATTGAARAVARARAAIEICRSRLRRVVVDNRLRSNQRVCSGA
jgi:hypothetical protein